MTIVTAQMSVSADGFYAGPKHADMQTWLEGPEAAGFFRVTRWAIDAEAWRQRLGFNGGEQNTNSQVIAETFDVGRRLRDGTAHGRRRRDSLGRGPSVPRPGVRGHQPAPADPATAGRYKLHLHHRRNPERYRPGPRGREREKRGDRRRRHAAPPGDQARTAGRAGTTHRARDPRGRDAPARPPDSGWTAAKGSNSPPPGSSPPPTSHTSATRSTVAARLSSTTEDETTSPSLPERKGHGVAPRSRVQGCPSDHGST